MDIKKMEMPVVTYMGKTGEVPISGLEKNSIFIETYPALMKYCREKNVEITGPTAAIYKTWDVENNKTQVMPAVRVAENSEASEFELFNVEAKEAYVGVHKGPYSKLKEAHEEMMIHTQKEGVMPSVVLEEYVVHPMDGVAEEDCETKIVYYL